jgi:peptidoglycan hydrolase CwlO-like protein
LWAEVDRKEEMIDQLNQNLNDKQAEIDKLKEIIKT